MLLVTQEKGMERKCRKKFIRKWTFVIFSSLNMNSSPNVTFPREKNAYILSSPFFSLPLRKPNTGKEEEIL
jgi:hypothetical protein